VRGQCVGVDDDRIALAAAGLHGGLHFLGEPLRITPDALVDRIAPAGIDGDVDLEGLLQRLLASAVGRVTCSAVNLL
jgi:hypothetical protein